METMMGLRMFVVEDAHNMHVMMGELFASLGGMKVVATVGTEAEALFWLEENAGEWDVTIVDLVLAQGSGINVVARARATHPEGRVVVFSGYTSPGVTEHLKHVGAHAVFDKADTQAFIAWLHELSVARG